MKSYITMNNNKNFKISNVKQHKKKQKEVNNYSTIIQEKYNPWNGNIKISKF